jgi:tetratricopeptide (TPR) repeat protein
MGAKSQSDLPPRRRRRWLRRLVVIVLTPVIAVGLLEGILRVSGYGHPGTFTLRRPVGETACYVPNPAFPWRFLPRQPAGGPTPFAYAVGKGEKTVRLFVLGGTAAAGEPDPAYSLARMLEAMLAECYPAARFEVVNAAMPYANSHVVRQVAAEVARHEADLLVVCLGNDEVIGPLGPANPFAPPVTNETLRAARQWLGETRTAQLIDNVLWDVRVKRGQVAQVKGLEEQCERLLRADDEPMKAVYARFASNLRAICRTGREAKAPVVLATTAVNLRDCSPLASVHREALGGVRKADWEKAWNTGIVHEQSARIGEAIDSYQAAVAIDDEHADLHYRLARCLRALKDYDRAQAHCSRACDTDALRLRADSKINDIIRAAAKEAGEGVHLVDVAASFQLSTADDHTPGAEWFYDHIRTNFHGTWLWAGAMLPTIQAALPAWAGPPRTDGVPELLVCAERLALTSFDQMRMAEKMTARLSRPPMKGKCDEREAAARMARHVRALTARMQDADVVAGDRATYERAIARTPEDGMLQERFGLFLLKVSRQPEEAEKHLREAIRLGQPTAERPLAQALVGREKYDEAVTLLRNVLESQAGEDWVNVQVELGEVLLQKGGARQAVEHLAAAVKVRPDDTTLQIELAKALDRAGRAAEALRQYEKIAEANPNDLKLANHVAWTLATSYDPKVRDGKKAVEMAQTLCRKSDRQEAEPLDTLAAAYAELGQFDGAIATAGEAIELARAGDPALADRISLRRELYRVGKPFHQPSPIRAPGK